MLFLQLVLRGHRAWFCSGHRRGLVADFSSTTVVSKKSVLLTALAVAVQCCVKQVVVQCLFNQGNVTGVLGCPSGLVKR